MRQEYTRDKGCQWGIAVCSFRAREVGHDALLHRQGRYGSASGMGCSARQKYPTIARRPYWPRIDSRTQEGVGMTAYTLISSDSHIIEPADLWEQRLDRQFKDRGPRLVHEGEFDQWYADGVKFGNIGTNQQ